MGMRRLGRIVIQTKSCEATGKVRSCRLCGHIWESKKSSGEPKCCPKCRSSLWDRQAVGTVTCRRCGHMWSTTMEHPPKCPSCGSKRWDADILTVVCASCGRRWLSILRKGDSVRCPVCGELGPGGYHIEGAKRSGRPRRMEVPLSEDILLVMWRMDNELNRAVFLRNSGLTPEQADVIVSFDRGDSVPEIASRMSMPVSEVMESVLPFMGLCESMGAKSWS